eukprot:m.64304 g.64304  ORF g.64304 m.64304 type:complete len:559 (+) comp12003_c0_seq3:86-1762(+)
MVACQSIPLKWIVLAALCACILGEAPSIVANSTKLQLNAEEDVVFVVGNLTAPQHAQQISVVDMSVALTNLSSSLSDVSNALADAVDSQESASLSLAQTISQAVAEQGTALESAIASVATDLIATSDSLEADSATLSMALDQLAGSLTTTNGVVSSVSIALSQQERSAAATTSDLSATQQTLITLLSQTVTGLEQAKSELSTVLSCNAVSKLYDQTTTTCIDAAGPGFAAGDASADCDGSTVGLTRFSNGELVVCDGSKFQQIALIPVGSSPLLSSQITFVGMTSLSQTLLSGDVVELNGEQDGAMFNTFFTVSAPMKFEVLAWGAGGGSTKRTSARTGGGGGFATATLSFSPGVQYYIVVGGAGEGGSQSPASNTRYNGDSTGGGRSGANSGTSDDSGAGGGFTGIFQGSVSNANALLIAGGGGGGAGDVAYGGGGGGASGGDASNWSGRGGGGGVQSGSRGGGAGGGAPLKGGNGSGFGAGGGGGYYGGGGGITTGPGAGGGGSGFIHSSATNGGYATSNNGVPPNTGSGYYKSNVGMGGSSGGPGGSGMLVLVVV